MILLWYHVGIINNEIDTNMGDLKLFWEDVVSKKRFYLPLLFFSIVGYSFSIYNRTVGIDDFTREVNLGSGNRMLSGRWGMILWNKLVGITVALDPFIDRFLALVFLILAAILLCYILYIICGNKRIISYTITASIFITYPLINSIWEYTGADFVVSGNLCLVTLAAIILRLNNTPFWEKVFSASLLLLLPISSYESAMFYYLTLICIIVLYDFIICGDELIFSRWLKKMGLFLFPVLIAFIARFLISYFINTIYDLEYTGGGSTGISWLHDSPFHVIKCMLAFNAVKYILTGLVYFPISVFVISLCLFVGYIFVYRGNHLVLFFLGFVVVLSLFSQSFLQGMELEYRHAQTISLFVAFTSFLLCTSVTNESVLKWIYAIFLVLCWHQAVYLNRILGLNNLRSDNEVALIHQIGIRISSEFDNKPVAFVGEYQKGPYITNQISVDENSWNGRLFYSIYDKFIAKLDRPYQYGANVNSVWGLFQLKECLNYFGYNIDLVDDKTYMEANKVAIKNKMKPYQIYDNGSYLIVNLGE